MHLKTKMMAGIVGVFVFVLGAIFTLSSPPVLAQYSEGPYGACEFGRSCEPTQVVTPTLKIKVNLTNGQAVDPDDYTVVVEPLQGSTPIDRVQIFVNGNLVDTFNPDDDGIARYVWDLSGFDNEDVTVRIVVFDNQGNKVERTFNVKVRPGPETPVPPTSPPSVAPTSPTGVRPPRAGDPLDFLRYVLEIIPQPIAISIPYLLLFMILSIIVLLFWRTRREADELVAQAEALARAKRLGDEKTAFIGLASHYLRTPITLVEGGADLMGTLQPRPASEVFVMVTSAIQEAHAAIERLLENVFSKANQAGEYIEAIVDTESFKFTKLIANPIFWAPMVVVGALLIIFNLAYTYSYSTGMAVTNMLTQASIFIALAIMLYNVTRSYQLRKRDKLRAEREEAHIVALDQARNSFIIEGINVLQESVGKINSAMTQVAEGEAKKLMLEGSTRLSEVLKKFSIASTIAPPPVGQEATKFQLANVVSLIKDKLSEKIIGKQLNINVVRDAQLASQQPAWITWILLALLDNAAEYSPNGANIEVAANVGQGGQEMIEVRDQGAGIPQDKLEEIFKPFAKAEGVMTFDHPGLGFSLYLARLLISNLGGEIHLQSTPGQGTVAQITFPPKLG